MAMTRRELTQAIAERRPHLPRREVERAVNQVFRAMAEALRRGERIEIRGFGSFIVKRRNERAGLNPRTGAAVHVPAKRTPFFKAGKEIRERVEAGRVNPDNSTFAAPAGTAGFAPVKATARIRPVDTAQRGG